MLVEALQRAGKAPSARSAVRQLMDDGVRPPVELMAFLNIDAPRRAGSSLYKAMFGASRKQEQRVGEAANIQRWYDEAYADALRAGRVPGRELTGGRTRFSGEELTARLRALRLGVEPVVIGAGVPDI